MNTRNQDTFNQLIDEMVERSLKTLPPDDARKLTRTVEETRDERARSYYQRQLELPLGE